MKGYIQVYTGNGKGKTTSALGLSMRAAGADLNVLIVQFLKSGDYSEIKALKRFSDRITVVQFGSGRFIKGIPAPEEIAAAARGMEFVQKAMKSNQYDIIIMEEANVAAACGVIQTDDILSIMEMKPENVELVITGRGADSKVIEKADLVTEMKEIKHYFQKGVKARTGIEK